MNILYVTFSLTIGGIEKLLVDIVNTAATRRNSKIYLCIINKKYDEYLINKIKQNVKVIILDRPVGGSKLKYIIKYTKSVIKNNIDIIHCQCENSVKFSLLCKIIKPKIKIFTTVHDTQIYLRLKKYETVIDKFVCKKIIAISEAVRKEILSRGIPESKVVRIYNAIDLKKFKSDKEEKRVDKNKFIIGNVSRLMPEKKGQDILIKAISKLKEENYNIECLFAGEAPIEENDNLEKLKKICEEWGVKENIKFLGNVYDIPKLLSSIDIFVMPSRYEGFGIALIEAMAKGVPCVASNIDGPKEIIRNNEYGMLFESENYYDLADKIKYIIKNIDKMKSDEIQKYVISNFNIESMMENLYKVYEITAS
ncbi:glycosyltransferase [Clostridium sp. BL-8]|uniref:glycosyltransferase n=1 Tax=Clostridium sp. BL-8 TaxID=349938 RepID=UPI00098BEBEB|nr:glycosyltransferase [Clostridium sp. BL-8]OOM79446.1 GDP-mannose-dependent alpha-(1-6)-phosphatidylinositol monomannoside mannosyltransferase [Clostridium sp. BL-8]